MRRARFAERVLSQVAPPVRAASIVGDLLETCPGGVRFWIPVARIGVSLLWKDVAAHPFRMAGLATAGAAMNLFMLGVIGIALLLPLNVRDLAGAGLHQERTIA